MLIISFKHLSYLLVFLSVCSLFCVSDDTTHSYTSGEEVVLWHNKVGPYHNPQETYAYTDLPFCAPLHPKRELKHKPHSLGVILEGDQLTDSGIEMFFKQDTHVTKICDLEIEDNNARIFKHAVKNHYWYQMYIDELPLWGMLGEYVESSEGEESFYLYTHKDIVISYNNDRIIEVNLTSETPKPLVTGSIHPLTYSVKWVSSNIPFEKRFDRYLDIDFFEHQIHWFSLFNSFIMVVFLCGLVILILMKTLKNDYNRFIENEDDELDRVVDESGWKQIHGDVFRAPPYLILFSAFTGTGVQLFFMIIFVLVTSLFSSMYDVRGGFSQAVVILYCITSIFSGYYSARFYKIQGGLWWKRNFVFTASFFPFVCACIHTVLNTIQIYHAMINQASVFSALYIVLHTSFMLFALWLLIVCPCTLAGTILARSVTPATAAATTVYRINAIKRPIPDGEWFSNRATLAIFAGLLPFGSIFVEMYFIFTSFWHYKVYYVYGLMFVVFLMLSIVVLCVTIVSTYIQLNAEDWRWWWSSIINGGSVAIYVSLYGLYYFFAKTHMYGIVQTVFYFGYMTLTTFLLFVLCGSIGYFGSSFFVHRIYAYIKSD